MGRGVERLESLLGQALPHLRPADREDLSETLQHDLPEAAGIIDASADRMERLVAAILRLSRLGRRELRLEELDMEHLVSSILDTFAYQIEQHSARVTIGPLPPVKADRTSMELILENLIDNAVKYLAPERDGRIEIRGWETETEVVFEIEDNGRGISPEQHAQVFRIFGRGVGKDVPGEGMGLAYVSTLLRRHDGRIEFEPAEGDGTIFRIALPIRHQI
jgi:signal transduction histidine kinase